MDIEKHKDGKKLDVKLIGRLDSKTAPELKEVLENNLNKIVLKKIIQKYPYPPNP